MPPRVDFRRAMAFEAYLHDGVLLMQAIASRSFTSLIRHCEVWGLGFAVTAYSLPETGL
jgi:hypothetical protein